MGNIKFKIPTNATKPARCSLVISQIGLIPRWVIHIPLNFPYNSLQIFTGSLLLFQRPFHFLTVLLIKTYEHIHVFKGNCHTIEKGTERSVHTHTHLFKFLDFIF